MVAEITSAMMGKQGEIVLSLDLNDYKQLIEQHTGVGSELSNSMRLSAVVDPGEGGDKSGHGPHPVWLWPLAPPTKK